jgi:superfamily II DNA/RNA helicase
VTALGKDGITVPFPGQAATLPDALAGVDILGRAQTGSGKTLRGAGGRGAHPDA